MFFSCLFVNTYGLAVVVRFHVVLMLENVIWK